MSNCLVKPSPRLRTNVKSLAIALAVVVPMVLLLVGGWYEKGYILISPGYNSSTIQDCRWERKWGGLAYDACQVIGIDNDGNLVLAGYYADIADLSPMASIRLYNARRTGGTFVLNMTPKGRLQWIASLDQRKKSHPTSMAFNSRGDIILTGDRGTIWKLNSKGENSTIISSEIDGCSVAVDSDDNIIVSKREGLVKLSADGTVAWEILKQASGNALTLDESDRIYVASERLHIIDENGSELVTADLPGWAMDIALDSVGNILVAGLVPKNGEVVEQPGQSRLGDSFLCMMDKEGRVIWNREWRSEAAALAVSAQNEIYVTGGYAVPTDFDPERSGSVQRHPDHDSLAIFVSKFDESGKFLGVKVGYEPWSFGKDLAFDSEGNLYIVGATRGDAFVARFDRGTF